MLVYLLIEGVDKMKFVVDLFINVHEEDSMTERDIKEACINFLFKRLSTPDTIVSIESFSDMVRRTSIALESRDTITSKVDS